MKSIKMSLCVFCIAGSLAIASCSSSTKSESKDVSQLDSVSKDLDQSNETLTAEAKKVEASLEKIDTELKTTK